MDSENHSNFDNISLVKHIILVLSGKGGVGKSSVTIQLAHALKRIGKKVGILDVDLCGPSIPVLMNMADKEILQCPNGWLPVYADVKQQLGVMSIAFLLKEKDDPVVWRGPKKNSMIKQFISDVHWGELDYLLIDTPPGTSDEHISIVENIQNYDPDGAVLVTTPQAVSLGDVRREISFCHKTGVKILGLVENMSGYTCPNCSECTNIFSTGGGESLSELAKIPFLGRIPIDPRLHPKKGSSMLDILDELGGSSVCNGIAASWNQD